MQTAVSFEDVIHCMIVSMPIPMNVAMICGSFQSDLKLPWIQSILADFLRGLFVGQVVSSH